VTAATLTVGDVVELRHGPFVSTWRVEKVIDAGAVLVWSGSVGFAGYDTPIDAPNGTPLTHSPTHEFLGRAHWGSARKVTA
jgi:hypothetical protein